jgi:hypothetical protein
MSYKTDSIQERRQEVMRKFYSTKALALIVLGLALAMSSACGPSGTWTGIVTNEVVINAPPAKVFAYLDDYKNQHEWGEGLKEIDCKGKGLGRVCTGITERYGQTYEGIVLTTDYVLNKRSSVVVLTDDGDVAYSATTLFLSHPQGTRMVTVAKCYSFQLPAVLAKLPHETVQKKLKENMVLEGNRIKANVEK